MGRRSAIHTTRGDATRDAFFIGSRWKCERVSKPLFPALSRRTAVKPRFPRPDCTPRPKTKARSRNETAVICSRKTPYPIVIVKVNAARVGYVARDRTHEQTLFALLSYGICVAHYFHSARSCPMETPESGDGSSAPERRCAAHPERRIPQNSSLFRFDHSRRLHCDCIVSAPS